MKLTQLLTVVVLHFLLQQTTFAQKKPLDHTVYDSWQSIGEKRISNSGQFIAYTVNVQEGDNKLYIQKSNGDTLQIIPRGYNGNFLPNSTYFICKIKPTFAETRQAKIDKKKGDAMPKDSLAIVNLTTNILQKIPNIKSYKISDKEGNLLAWLSEKTTQKAKKDSASQLLALAHEADSLNRAADSLRQKLADAKTNGLKVLKIHPNQEKKNKSKDEGDSLFILNLVLNDTTVIPNVTEYVISEKNQNVAAVIGSKVSDSTRKIMLWQPSGSQLVYQQFQSAKNLTFSEDGASLAFIVDRDSSEKALRHFYALGLFRKGDGTAKTIASRYTKGIPDSAQISEFADLSFSKSGKRLFFGTAEVLPLPDTSLPEFERVKLDVWHYKEDDLHTVQLFNLERDLKKNYLAMYDLESASIQQIGNENLRRVYTTFEGDGKYFYAVSDSGRRVEMQWMGRTPVDIYRIQTETGEKIKIAENFTGSVYASYTGTFALLYDTKARSYRLYNSTTGSKTIIKIPTPVYDVENDVPADPDNYGIAGWSQTDDAVYIYDQYDIWKVSTSNGLATLAIPSGREGKVTTQYVSLDHELKYLPTDSLIAFNQYHQQTKNNQFVLFSLATPSQKQALNTLGNDRLDDLDKAKNGDLFIFTKQNYQHSPDLYVTTNGYEQRLSEINPQQSQYLWGTAELYKWKAYTGKETEGILYKPENFDPKKKYPLIAYFYERNNQTLYNYQAPSPTPSRLNIPFFVSRGYIVFVLDIWYKTGHPGESAYNYIVSGVRSLVKKGFVDSTKMGIQGQSWGGYQTAYLITRVPNMFAAAWAGAPVVDMFSAYGGIRWQSGMNRQFQYEKTQSRIGATIWDHPELYVENSPMFKLNKVKTPVVIMANDADGAVPWYQGIEMFTDLRRLGKPVWMLNYNGEAHNLVERKNRKDIQIREQQFFDWLLKGEKPAPWIEKGVPAVMKGRTWGL